MKIVAISDTHSLHREIVFTEEMLKADVLIHAGDISFRGESRILNDFAEWFGGLPFPNKACIAGNHEVGFASNNKNKRDFLNILNKFQGVHYLEDSFITIDNVKIYGSSWTPFFCDWEFNLSRGAPLREKWSLIPDDVNVLVTHGPPYGVLDRAPRGVFDYENVGCADLRDRIATLKNLKLHIFGHIHKDSGQMNLNGIEFINAAICGENYKAINPPRMFEL